MAVQISFDTSHNPKLPTFVLATRSGKKLGILTNISDVHLADTINAPMDISFQVHKSLDVDPLKIQNLKRGNLVAKIDSSTYEEIITNDGKHIFVNIYNDIDYGRETTQLWDEIKNFRKVWIPEWDLWFTLTLEINEESETIKNISLVPNSEFELSNVNVHNLEINTESDILREDYINPTVFYSADDPSISLLHRVLSYTKGFEIKYVDDSLKNIQRTFSLDGENIHDTFNTIAEEIQCLFVYGSGTNEDGTIERSISVYDLRTYCYDCGYRGEFSDVCPECGSTNLEPPYGEDTTILVDNEALSESISLSTDTDSIKNCFRLLTGDGLMDAAVMSSNPNGSQYLWYFTDEMMEDMSDALKTRLKQYDIDFNYYEDEYPIPLSASSLTYYNYLINKYAFDNEELVPIDTIIGYAELMNTMFDVMDFKIYLKTSMMPTIQTDTNAEEQAAKITSGNMPYVGVQNISTASASTVNNAVLTAVKILVNRGYTVKINTSTYSSTMYIWTGSFVVTANNDDTDTAITDIISISITGDYDTFVRQKIEKAVAQGDTNNYSIAGLFESDYDEFVIRLSKYSRDILDDFYSASSTAIGIMVELGISNPTSAVLIEGGLDAYYTIYLDYYRKMKAVQAELAERDEELTAVQAIYDTLLNQKKKINDILDIDTYLGDTLAIELYSYKMEDDYENSNYISDGLNNAELFRKADEFIKIATNEIHKAATPHHSISTTMHNLLVIPEFEPLVDHFAVGNWIRIKIDGKIYKVKLLSYTIDYDGIETLSVDFSDAIGSGDQSIASILSKAESMAKSYDSIKYQAANGTSSKRTLGDWVQNGLDLTTMKIVGATNQSQTWDETGLTMKQWDDITEEYTDFQSKYINTTLAFTTDGWETTETALGRFTFWNPISGEYEEGYGVIAKQLIGNLILGQEVGIYNDTGSINITDGGIIITANADDSINNTEFCIQKEYTDSNGNLQTIKQMYIDEAGNLIFDGNYIEFSSGKTLEERMQEVETTASTAKSLIVSLSNESHVIGTDKDGNNGDYTDCYTIVYVMYGDSDVTNSASISITADSGITGSWNTNAHKYSISNMSIDSGSVYFTVGYNGLTVTKSMSISKSKAGATGGSGEAARRYDLIVSHAAIAKSQTGVYNPISITLSAKYQDGTGNPANYSGRFKIETTTDNSTWTAKYTSSANQASYTYTVPADILAIRCSLYLAGGTNTLLDQQTIPIVNDGKNGATGADAYTIIMTNESHTFSGDDTKAIASSAICGVIAYKGATQVSATIGTITGQVSGLTTSIQNNSSTSAQFTVTVTTALTTRQGTLTIPITVDSKSFSRKFSWSLALNGANGEDGEPTRSYILNVDPVVVKKSMSGNLTPTSITMSAFYRDGISATRTAYAGRFVIQESTNGSSYETKVTSSANESSRTYNISSSDVKMIKCLLYASGGTTTQLDSQTVAIVSDAADLTIGSRNLIRMSNILRYDDNYYFYMGHLITDQSKYVKTNTGQYIEVIENEE